MICGKRLLWIALLFSFETVAMDVRELFRDFLDRNGESSIDDVFSDLSTLTFADCDAIFLSDELSQRFNDRPRSNYTSLASRALESEALGTWLIRPSSQENSDYFSVHTLSIKGASSVEHRKIFHVTKAVMVRDKQYFPTENNRNLDGGALFIETSQFCVDLVDRNVACRPSLAELLVDMVNNKIISLQLSNYLRV